MTFDLRYVTDQTCHEVFRLLLHLFLLPIDLTECAKAMDGPYDGESVVLTLV